MRIVFVHGWGLAPNFWDALTPSFSEHECGFIDLGFLGKENLDAAGPTIYITHSLGTLWALKNCAENMQGLVSINGFSSFRRFASKDALAEMQKSLKENPRAHMADFWQGIGAESSDKMNADRLAEGLDWLATWNVRAELKALPCPVLSLAGAQDNILPLPQMQKEWAGQGMAVCENGGHMLPMSHPDWCAQQIKGFIS